MGKELKRSAAGRLGRESRREGGREGGGSTGLSIQARAHTSTEMGRTKHTRKRREREKAEGRGEKMRTVCVHVRGRCPGHLGDAVVVKGVDGRHGGAGELGGGEGGGKNEKSGNSNC